MSSIVQHAPRFTEKDAIGIAHDVFGLDVSAKKLPSERDQNFHLSALSGEEYVLKVANATERIEVIDTVAQPFYEKINVLSARGPVSESQLWEAMNSIEAAKKLADEEKVLLVTLFGQILGAQKSKVVDAVVVEKPAKSSVTNKKAALTCKSSTN